MGTSDDEPDRVDAAGDPTAGEAPGTGSLFEPVPGRNETDPPRPERIVMSPGRPPDEFTGGASGDSSGSTDSSDDDSEGHRLRTRPYVLTKGRTHARPDLAVETLVSAEPTAPWHRNLGAEYQAVRRLCAQPRSVAEIAATLSVPLGVARVLVSDLADTGFVRVHTAPPTPDGRPGTDLMNRVLTGLQRL